MDFEKVIKTRSSVRSYKTKKIPKSILRSLIKDATKAPSSNNEQP
ncbi:MAG: nitroreductase family protein [Nanoarchaeota archaeon]|nr:nitroreductase family protein [Nanoarchaeota archaeon]